MNNENDGEIGVKFDKRKSPEHREHLRQIGFQKGREKTGGSVATPPEVKRAMLERTPEAIEVMLDVMFNSKNDSARVKAAAYFLDPFVSKAATEQKVEVNHTVAVTNLLADAKRLHALEDKNKTIDVTPVVVESVPVVANYVPLNIGDEDEAE